VLGYTVEKEKCSELERDANYIRCMRSVCIYEWNGCMYDRYMFGWIDG